MYSDSTDENNVGGGLEIDYSILDLNVGSRISVKVDLEKKIFKIVHPYP